MTYCETLVSTFLTVMHPSSQTGMTTKVFVDKVFHRVGISGKTKKRICVYHEFIFSAVLGCLKS